MELRLYLSEEERVLSYSNCTLLWHQPSLTYSSAQEEVSHEVEVPMTAHLLANGTVYLHAVFTQPGFASQPESDHTYHPYSTFNASRAVVGHYREAVTKTATNLLSGVEEQVYDKKATAHNGSLVGWWKPSMTVSLLADWTVFPRGMIPQPMDTIFKFDDKGTRYYPPLYFDEFWLMKEHMLPINESLSVLPLTLRYKPIGMIQFQMQLQMEKQWAQQQKMGMATVGDTDEIKRILTDTNPYLLGVTAVVSILHMVFDTLAFKNDIEFWRNNRSMEGLSTRKIITDSIVSVIIFLYLLDNDTSWMILVSSGFGTLIELWKIKKAVDVELVWGNTYYIKGIALRCPLVVRYHESYQQSGTREFDDKAMHYVSFVLYPLIVGYAAYSLIHVSHKSWYSWALSSLTGAVYTFGFVMMTPQLFINYKLKSVAHLPWRTMCYKALNTFIDDLFAFIITMPTMHRLACFRDDIVFFIYLYQVPFIPVQFTDDLVHCLPL